MAEAIEEEVRPMIEAAVAAAAAAAAAAATQRPSSAQARFLCWVTLEDPACAVFSSVTGTGQTIRALAQAQDRCYPNEYQALFFMLSDVN